MQAIRPRPHFHRGPSNPFRLVEAALAKLGAVQGHGNYRHGICRQFLFEGRDRLGQHSAENVGSRAHAAILQ